MATNLYDAHKQWAIRTPDESFSNLEELYKFTNDRKRYSKQEIKPIDQINLFITPYDAIAMNGNSPPAMLSNWAFGQLCRIIGAPGKYLRTLPAEMARDCLQYGINNSSDSCRILTREEFPEDNGDSNLWASALTSQSYGRIWDADVIENLDMALQGTGWHLPPSKSSGRSGLYASDRDMFAFMINDENPIEVEGAKLGRGFFCWNSETGASTFGLTTFLYNYICDNHIVWGADQIQELKIYHRKYAFDRFHDYAIPALNRFVDNKSFDDNVKDSVYRAMNTRIGNNLEDVLKWFKDRPFTRNEVTNAWESGNTAGEDVRTAWGIVQGLTNHAQDIPFIDKKVNLERRAGALLVA